MSTEQKQACPFCSTPARFFYRDYENRKHFFCDVCTEFEVSKSAEKAVAGGSSEWRAQNSAAAKNAPSGSFYQLTRPMADHANTTEEYVGVYIKKDT